MGMTPNKEKSRMNNMVGGASGISDIKEQEAKLRGGINTERMVFPNKDGSIQIVPLVNLKNVTGNRDDTVYSYPEAGISMNKDAWDNFKKRDEELENVSSYFTWPKLGEEFSAYCIATWLENNAKEAFKEMNVGGSSMFGADPAYPLQIKTQYLIHCLNLTDDPDRSDLKTSVFKFGQSTILGGFENDYKQAGGRFKNSLYSVSKTKKEQKYGVTFLNAYEDVIPEIDIAYDEFTLYDPEFIIKRLRQFGISVPDAEFFMPE
jgi:hypothetical protein